MVTPLPDVIVDWVRHTPGVTDYSLANLTQPAVPPKKSRTALYVSLAVVAALLLVGVAVMATLLATRPSATAPGSGSATPQANGISRPDASCVTTTGTDHQDMWNADGWWAGRIDGDEKQMAALAVLQLKLGGHRIDSAWICAPRPNG